MSIRTVLMVCWLVLEGTRSLANTSSTAEIDRSILDQDLAVRSIAVPVFSVDPVIFTYLAKGTEHQLAEKLTAKVIRDLKTLSYLVPKSAAGSIADIAKREKTNGALVLRIGLEEISGGIYSASGSLIKELQIKFRIGDFDSEESTARLSRKIADTIVRVFTYRGFVTSASGRTAVINLGSSHAIKSGMRLELFEFRGETLASPRRRLVRVKVDEVLNAAESRVSIDDIDSNISEIKPFSKVSFENTTELSVSASNQSLVDGRWWIQVGGELVSIGAESAATQYEKRVFKVNSSPFGFLEAGNDTYALRAGFGSARSETETLNFVDLQGTYAAYQTGSTQNSITISGGARTLVVNVVPVPGMRSALESTLIFSPLAEFRYRYVPRSRIRAVGVVEAFWPVYSSGASIGALAFAFGGGLGGGLQIAISPRLGAEVFARVRYLRRLIDAQSGVQERQSSIGAGLIFTF